MDSDDDDELHRVLSKSNTDALTALWGSGAVRLQRRPRTRPARLPLCNQNLSSSIATLSRVDELTTRRASLGRPRENVVL